MTREHKLALIVGFSLVLVLGVLISDHFSKARQVQMAENIAPVSARQVGAVTPGVKLGSEPGSSVGSPIAAGPQPRTDLEALPGIPPTGSAKGDGLQLTMGGAPNLPLVHTATTPPYPPYGDQHIDGPVPPQAAPTTPQIPLQRHDVHDGDTLYGIAKKYYGDGNLWQKVREYNKDKVTSSGDLREGVTLLIPPKDVLLGKPYTPPTAPAMVPPPSVQPAGGKTVVTDPLAAKPDPKAAVKGDFKEYVVKDGDTLVGIARKMLKDGKRWNEIVEANKGTLADPESLAVGMKLRIPSK